MFISALISENSSWRWGVNRQVGGGGLKKYLSYICLLLLIYSFSACVPPSVPPQLSYTPGPAVRLNGLVYETEVFRVQYPAGWRVITSAATDDTAVIFAADAGDALLMVGKDLTEAPSPAGYEGSLHSERRDIPIQAGFTVSVILNAATENWTHYEAVLDQVAASISQVAESKTAN